MQVITFGEMDNIAFSATEDGELNMAVDLLAECGQTGGGNVRVSSSRGRRPLLVGDRTVYLNLNIFRGRGKAQIPDGAALFFEDKSALENISMKLDDTILTLTIDLASPAGKTGSGRTRVAAVTGGIKSFVAGATNYRIGMSIDSD